MKKSIYTRIIYEIIFIILAIISVVIAIENIYNNYYPIRSNIAVTLDFYIQLIFICDYIIRFYISKNRKLFVKNNIPDLIAISPFNSLLKVFRLAKILKITRLVKFAKLTKMTKLSRLLALLIRFMNKIKKIFKTNGLVYVLIFSLITILIAAFSLSVLENLSFRDALWWSFVTATTVGYGDISPTTTLGRFIAMILMLVGIGTIGLLTGTIATYFLSTNTPSSNDSSSETIDFISKTNEFTKNEKIELINFIKFIKHKRIDKK